MAAKDCRSALRKRTTNCECLTSVSRQQYMQYRRPSCGNIDTYGNPFLERFASGVSKSFDSLARVLTVGITTTISGIISPLRRRRVLLAALPTTLMADGLANSRVYCASFGSGTGKGATTFAVDLRRASASLAYHN